MPTVAGFNIVRMELFQVTMNHEIPPLEHEIARFDLDAGAVLNPAVLTFMIYPSELTLINKHLPFSCF
jgi:hypothetical protein